MENVDIVLVLQGLFHMNKVNVSFAPTLGLKSMEILLYFLRYFVRVITSLQMSKSIE